jgi:adenosine deaminase/aminodeoxyfutalosine deaminase
MTSPNPREKISRWPKAELHLHLEGSMRPSTVVELAARHGVKIAEHEVAERYAYKDFLGFIEAFKWVTSFLQTPADYALVFERLAKQLLRENVVYAEITLSTGVTLWRRQDVEASFAALREAERRVAAQGLRVQWIMDATRQFGAEKAMEVARWAARMRGEGVVAFGMGGDELSVPAEEFRAVYDFIRDHGLRAVVHAGEVGGPDEVRKAIEVLGAERIDHGIAAVHDPGLMEMLKERRIPLDLCPVSNLRTGALSKLLGRTDAKLADHPVGEFFRKGLQINLSTDDPPMFGTDLVLEYLSAMETGMTLKDLARVAEMGFEAAFLPQAEKQALTAKFREATRAQGLIY